MILSIVGLYGLTVFGCLCHGIHLGRLGQASLCASIAFIVPFWVSYVWCTGDTLWVGGQWFMGESWCFSLDNWSRTLCTLVVIVGSGILLYSIEYVWGDPALGRFLGWVVGFIVSMVVLVSAGNWLVLFLGWEGIGVFSFLLISFWDHRWKVWPSASKAMIVNRFSDVILLSGVCISWYLCGSLNYGVQAGYSSYVWGGLVIVFLFGAVTKSAQWGLHIWLPDAMEGPTPVSSLIHAATLVTAGIYVLIRVSAWLETIPYIGWWLIVWGLCTCLGCGWIGLCQWDLKKIIAYSTCAQLGLMLSSMGRVAPTVEGWQHLLAHGAFKALLFLCAGAVVHAALEQQDLRGGGGRVKLMPFVYMALLVASLALMGIIGFSGGDSKEPLLEIVWCGDWCVWLIIGGTVGYALKCLQLTWGGPYRGSWARLHGVHEVGILWLAILGSLSIVALMMGSVYWGELGGSGSVAWHHRWAAWVGLWLLTAALMRLSSTIGGRRYGRVFGARFGLGFERLGMLLWLGVVRHVLTPAWSIVEQTWSVGGYHLARIVHSGAARYVYAFSHSGSGVIRWFVVWVMMFVLFF